MDRKSIMIFGVGTLQKTIIERCKSKGLITIGIDPNENATCRKIVDVFKIIKGDNYERTLAVANKYQIKGIVTAATDKPLIMMACIAESMKLPFYSIDTAVVSTDKFLMKGAFLKGDIPCAKGKLITSPEEIREIKEFNFPVILKPRDNSGSRGVIFCNNIFEIEAAFSDVLRFTRKDSVLVEEYIEGKEYSIESLHFNGDTKVIQYTEKITTPLPYNVELGHIQPANLSFTIKEEINLIVSKIAKALSFSNCASHTELKINKKGIFVIETSPRLGGDYITSHLVPLSTGVNMEDQVINLAIGEPVDYSISSRASMVSYLNFPVGKKVKQTITEREIMKSFPEIVKFSIDLKAGDVTEQITNSLNRYGQFVLVGDNLVSLNKKKDEIIRLIEAQTITP